MKEKDAIAKDKTYFTPSFRYAMHVYPRILYFGNFQTPNPMCMHRIIPKSWKARTARAQTMVGFGGQIEICTCSAIYGDVFAYDSVFGLKRGNCRSIIYDGKQTLHIEKRHERRCQIEFSLAMASFCFTISVILSYKITHRSN